jgi:YD repeat-containing protein
VKYTWTPTGLDSNSYTLLTAVEQSDGTTTQYTYGETVDGNITPSYFLTGVIDEEANRFITYKRQSNNPATVLEEWRAGDASGSGALGRLNMTTSGKIMDQDGKQFAFTPIANSSKPTGYTTPCPECSGPQGKTLSYNRSGMLLGNLTEIKDWKNQRTTFAYDTYGRMTEKKEAVGTALERTTTWTYPTDSSLREPLTQVEQVKDASGTARLRTTTYTYTDLAATYPSSSPCSGAHGGVSVPCDSTRRLLTAVTVSVSDGSTDRTWTMTYNGYGLMDTMTAPTGQVTKWTWTADGQVATVTRAYGTSLARTTTFGEHTNQGPTWRQDASGLYTRWTIDLRGRIVKEDVGIPGSGGIGERRERPGIA